LKSPPHRDYAFALWRNSLQILTKARSLPLAVLSRILCDAEATDNQAAFPVFSSPRGAPSSVAGSLRVSGSVERLPLFLYAQHNKERIRG
jgi:hypothetical protein